MTTLPATITTDELMSVDYRYAYTKLQLREDWQKLCKTTEYKKGSQFKPGMKLCQHFCPNFWDIQSASGQSFAKSWQNPIIMDRVREWGLKSMKKLWMSWIRRAVYMASGLPNSSFYRPHFAKQIIEMTGKKTGMLFDPCAGWGGRMLGTAAANWDYYSCEPNAKTYQNLQQMVDFIVPSGKVSIANTPVESFDISSIGPIDIVLTSPPYFNLEVYDDSSDQSYNKHSTYGLWRDDWLLPLIDRCLNNLQPDGISAWNVMNMGKIDLSGDVIAHHRLRGWNLVATVGFDSPLANIRAVKNKDVTYIFKK